MKKSLLLSLSAILIGLMFAGCASVNVTKNGADTVYVENTGAFLFYCIPICSGDPDYPNQQVCNWFSNTVKVETNVKLLEEAAAEEGARGIRNIVSRPDEETIIFCLLKRKICKTSAELIRN